MGHEGHACYRLNGRGVTSCNAAHQRVATPQPDIISIIGEYVVCQYISAYRPSHVSSAQGLNCRCEQLRHAFEGAAALVRFAFARCNQSLRRVAIAKLPTAGVPASPSSRLQPARPMRHCDQLPHTGCRFRSNSEQFLPGWVLVNVATPTASVRLAGMRIDRRDNGLAAPSGDGC